MMEGLTACFTLERLTLEGLRADLVTSLEGGPMEALATEVEMVGTKVEMVGKWQVEEQGHAFSNFNELDAFRQKPSGMKIAKHMNSFISGGNMLPAWRSTPH